MVPAKLNLVPPNQILISTQTLLGLKEERGAEGLPCIVTRIFTPGTPPFSLGSLSFCFILYNIMHVSCVPCFPLSRE